MVDVIGLEIGYRLIPLVDKNQGGQLMSRVKGVRRKLSQELGFLIQPVHIRDNLNLSPTAYRLTLMGVPLGEGEIHPDRELAINPGQVFGALKGIKTTDPTFGLEAVWIDPAMRDEAQTLGYTVVDTSTVVATHLSHLLHMHAHELLGHEEVQQLLDMLATNIAKTGGRPGAESTAAGQGTQGAAEHAGRRRADSRHAHHRRNFGGTRPGKPKL